MKTHSERLSQLQGHFFADLERRINQMEAEGKRVYRLDIGSPDLPPATHIISALHKSADQPSHHGYQPLRGSQEVRLAWTHHYQQHYSVKLNPDKQVLPLIGSKEGIFLITQAVVDPGDVVLVPDPGYLVYTQAARFAQAEPYFIPLLADNGWLPDLDSISAEVIARARLLWLNYPNNPTSAVASKEFFNLAAAFARRNDLLLCHDAAYNLVIFDGRKPISMLEIPGASDLTIEFNTLSKSYNMAGWRMGAALGNIKVLESLRSLLTGVNSGSFRPANDAAVAALTGDQTWITHRNQVYTQRRDLVLRTLERLGWVAETPQAGLYVWFRTPIGYTSSADFCLALLEKTGVSLTPGNIFGQQGEGYVRLSFTVPDENLREALDLLGNFRNG